MDWIRFLPFAIVATNLLCWAIIEWASERPIDITRVTILTTGFSVFAYILSLALNYSWLDIDWPPEYYDLLRVIMGVTVIGTPSLVIFTVRAIRNRRARHQEELQ